MTSVANPKQPSMIPPPRNVWARTAKSDAVEWHVLKPPILGALMEHQTADLPVIEDDGGDDATESDDDEVVAQIKELLDTRVRPAVAQDGGDIVFHGFEDGVVTNLKVEEAGGFDISSAESVLAEL